MFSAKRALCLWGLMNLWYLRGYHDGAGVLRNTRAAAVGTCT